MTNVSSDRFEKRVQQLNRSLALENTEQICRAAMTVL